MFETKSRKPLRSVSSVPQCSMCSGSMLVTMAIVAGSRVKVPSLSSASTTIHSPCPTRAFEPQAWMMPPFTTVGSKPPASSSVATSVVVVVLPWVPATAMFELQAHQFGQHLGPAHHRQMPRRGRRPVPDCRT